MVLEKMFEKGDGVVLRDGNTSIIGFVNEMNSEYITFMYGFNLSNNAKIGLGARIKLGEDTSVTAIEEDYELYERLISKFNEDTFKRNDDSTETM